MNKVRRSGINNITLQSKIIIMQVGFGILKVGRKSTIQGGKLQSAAPRNNIWLPYFPKLMVSDMRKFGIVAYIN